MCFVALKSVFPASQSTRKQHAPNASRDIFCVHWNPFWSSVFGGYIPIILKAWSKPRTSRKFQGRIQDSFSRSRKRYDTLLILETWRSDLSGLKLLSSSCLSVCGSVLVLILQEEAETHARLNRTFRGFNWARDDFPATNLTLPGMKGIFEDSNIQHGSSMPFAQRKLTVTGLRNWKPGKKTQTT